MWYTTRMKRPLLATSVSASLLGLSLVVSLASCSDSGEGGKPIDGATLFNRNGCIACHGMNRQGGGLGPVLKGLGQHWTTEQLVAYLEDPKGYAEGDERLKAQGAKYRSPMPPYANLSVDERTTLASWLLAD